MSYAVGTTHYNLPQTVGTDKRDWFDTNQAFRDIDEALFGAAESAAQSATDIIALTSRVGDAESEIVVLEEQISTLRGTVNTHSQSILENGTNIADVRQDTEDMIVAKELTEAQMNSSTELLAVGTYFRYNDVLYRVTRAIAIGDTIVPNTNCIATNVGTELNSKQAYIDTINTDLYSAGALLLSADVESAQSLAFAQAVTNFNTIKVRIGAYYSAQNRNLYVQAFDIDLRHLFGSDDEFIYSWYLSPTEYLSVVFGISLATNSLIINDIHIGTSTANSFGIYAEAYGYKQTL